MLAQNFREDLLLVGKRDFAVPDEFNYYHGTSNDQQILKTKHKNFAASYNPVTLTFKSAMLLYQNILSPQLSRECPYEITCSNFCKQSIKEYGLIKGTILGADRILRCNRISILDVHAADVDVNTGKIVDLPSKYQ